MNNDITYTGKEIAQYIINITPNKDYITYSWIDKFVLPNKFELKEIRVDTLLSDSYFLDYYMSYLENVEGSKRYHYSDSDGYYVDLDGNPVDISDDDLYLPIVIVDDMLIDGFSRAANNLHDGEETIMAYVAIK